MTALAPCAFQYQRSIFFSFSRLFQQAETDCFFCLYFNHCAWIARRPLGRVKQEEQNFRLHSHSVAMPALVME
ncbi:hypothetical protein AMEX_G5461 [Astyanax mexicanus]|uniref:Uncharacterized protein n=1 Tax=Astyanax mexicanus TaxID=7994 RepID=A0A8T2M9I8_ASTMX|nr:hypothetical protein AMEX_G5461 [Astyanax mexicanus]